MSVRPAPHQSVSMGEGWAVIEDIGGRSRMEDRFVAAQRVAADVMLFGVFDGHNGAGVAGYCSSHVASHIRRELSDNSHLQHQRPVEHALATAIEGLDSAGRMLPGMDDVGSTACMLVLTAKDAWFVNVGDSRAIVRVGRKVHQMTLDHKPTVKSELDRVRRYGGFVSNTDGTWRVNGRLNLSRSIGDWSMRPFIIPTPTIVRYSRATDIVEEYVVLGSDGLYDVMTNQEVATMVDAEPHTERGIALALNSLVVESRRRGSQDNITIVYVGLMRAENSTEQRESRGPHTATASLAL